MPLSTAYAVTEALGSESGVGRRATQAPMFVGVFAFQIILSAMTVLCLGSGSLSKLIILPNIIGGVLLPIILILSLKLINNKRLMGEFTNSRFGNVIAISTTVLVIVLSGILFVQTVKAQLFPELKKTTEIHAVMKVKQLAVN